MNFSILICSYNPRPDYMRRVLESLRAQDLPKEEWELLLIDNASDQVLADHYDLKWHPNGRHLRENQPGKTIALLHGIRESRGEILIVVDDDNLPAADYLSEAKAISDKWPMLGIWGGQVVPEFASPPAAWTRPYWGYLALREFSQDKWSNLMNEDCIPVGAGMCIRRSVALAYEVRVQESPLRRRLDRRGKSLVSGGDTDIAYLACQLGLGTALFRSLKLIHLIPDVRLTEDYLARLIEGIGCSRTIVDTVYGISPAEPTFARKCISLVRLVRSNRRERRFKLAWLRGVRSARQIILECQPECFSLRNK